MGHSVSLTRIKGFVRHKYEKIYFLFQNQWPVSSETRS